MNQDEWGWLLTVLLLGNLIVSIVAAALIANHHRETTLRGTTTHTNLRP